MNRCRRAIWRRFRCSTPSKACARTVIDVGWIASPASGRCMTCDYRGFALICWEITDGDVERATESQANGLVIIWAKSFVADRRTP